MEKVTDINVNTINSIPHVRIALSKLINALEDYSPGDIDELEKQVENHEERIGELEENVGNIEELIPNQASSSNQLADKDFVNSSIASNTGTYRGSLNVCTDLELEPTATHDAIADHLNLQIQGNNNDYCFVEIPTSTSSPTEISKVERYKWVEDITSSWKYEYTLNNSSYTASQWAAINSGITEEIVETLPDIPQLEEKVEELEDTAVRTNSYDGSVAVGLADNLRGDTVVDAEFYKRKTGGTQSVGSGIAAIKEVRGKSIVWNQLLQEGKLVDMGLPSGTLWASCNIDVTQPNGFAASPFQYECSFFSWGNVDGHNPISNSAFDYDWGSVNQSDPYYEGQIYGETQGNTLTSNIPVGDTYDAARVNVGSLWRMPTSSDFAELFNNSIFIDSNGNEIDSSIADKRVVISGIRGLYLESKFNGARLFFSCSGGGSGCSWNDRGSSGLYWSSTWNSARYARHLRFNSGGVNPQYNNYRYYGFSLRPVISKSVIDNGKGGHKYAQYNNNISDLTLMFGDGNEPATVEEFEQMFPLDYYDYNAGEVIPFAGQNLTTTGKNQYNHATGKANLLGGKTYQISGSDTYTSATIDGVAITLDSNNCFTTTKDCVLDVTGGNDEDTIVALYNGENVSFEPYVEHTLVLNPSQWRDKQGNLVFPYGGMHGVDNVRDYAKVDADGHVRKAVRVFGSVDLGDLTYTENGPWMQATTPSDCADVTTYAGVVATICAKFIMTSAKVAIESGTVGYGYIRNNKINLHNDGNYTTTTFKAAMQGVYLIYELATPVEVELAEPIYAKYLVDKDGIEEITLANGTKPYTTMANLSILYAMDARGEIKNLPKNYLSKESAENMLNAMQSAGVIASYTMTWDSTNNRYAFVITAPVTPEPEETND